MGSAPESEIEVQNIVNYLMPQADSFIMYKSYHSWGQQFFTRWDYTDTELPPDHEELVGIVSQQYNKMSAEGGF